MSDGVVILTMLVPMALFLAGLFGIYTYFVPEADPFHIGVLVTSAALIVVSYLVAASGALLWGVAVAALVPWVTVLGYETFGHRHQAGQLAKQAEVEGTAHAEG